MESHSDDIIRLNVGGSHYSTTKQTLLRDSNSFFAQFVTSAETQEAKSPAAIALSDGSYFIDRDGFLFTFILDYLRSGKVILPENFNHLARLREEAIFFQLEDMQRQLEARYLGKSTPKGSITNGLPLLPAGGTSESGGYITIGYRGTFAFGRDGQTDVKFRKLNRILVCGKVSLCREVFGETLNESRDPDREGQERYTSRLYLKHQCLEKACDTMAEKGFKLVATCCSGANGLAPGHSTNQSSNSTQQNIPKELMNQRNSAEYEEQRWAHYTEFVFYREPRAPAFDIMEAVPITMNAGFAI